MYMARFTRPDILFAVTYLATKCENPSKQNMNQALHIIAYLATVGDYSLTFVGPDINLVFYIDASTTSHSDMRGHSAIIATLGSAPIMTRSVKQKLVALHSTDAEMIAVTEGLTYVIWIRLLLSELLFEQTAPTPIFQDNMSAILLYNGGGQFKRSKHMFVKKAYIKDLIEHGIASFPHISGLTIPADGLTKPVPASQIKNMLDMLHMEHMSFINKFSNV
jgi:hypothetical protein